MGKGVGAGQGTGKGVKGSWRVNAFLLLLTGWQAVLLPWSPLILKDAGFSATSVGVLSGGTTMAASLGVVVCLHAMRKSRSGAVRRLLLWLLLLTAFLLQGCGVGLELRHLSQGGAMPSCVNGWLFSPATPILLLNNSSTPTTPHLHQVLSSQQPDGLAFNTTTQPPPPPPPPSPLPPHGSHSVNPHLQHTSSYQPTSANYTTTTTTPRTTSLIKTTTPPPPPPPPPPHSSSPSPPSPIITTTTTTTPPVTTTSIQPTVPSIKTSTKKFTNTVHLNNKVSSVGTLISGKDYSTEAPRGPPVGQGKHHAAHKPVIPAKGDAIPKHRYSNFHQPHVSSMSYDRGKNFGKTKYPKDHNSVQLPNDDDHSTSQQNLDDDDDDDEDDNNDDDSAYLQEEYEYDNPEESEENEVDYKDDSPKVPNHYPSSVSRFLPSFDKRLQSASNSQSGVSQIENFIGMAPSNSYQHYLPAKATSALWKPRYSQKTPNIVKHSFHNSHHKDLLAALRKQAKERQAPLNDQESFQSIPSARHQTHNDVPSVNKERRPHHASNLMKPSDIKSQYEDYGLHQSGFRHIIHRRSRRDLAKTKNRSHSHPVKAETKERKPRRDDKLENKPNPVEDLKSDSVKVAVAVLLVLGGLAGAGIEAAVAQLWHCIVHGYDESGVNEDVLQRTITHTFHLSTYGNHKTWTSISSGGWVMGAGVASVLACLAGTGGGSYVGLLGVHLALGLGALLLLLILPVPYGSIDPPRTRRPLSLYLDDEVLREGVRRLTFHIWVFINGCLAALSLTFSLWLLQEMTTEGWLMGSQVGAVGMTLVCESLALHTQRRLVIRWGLHGLMGVCGVSLMLHYGFMWASKSVAVVVMAHAGLGVTMAFLWVAVKHNALLLATVSDQEREAWASWWCWRLGVSVGAAVWGVGVSGTGGRVRPLLLLATIAAAILASSLCVTAILSRRNSRTRRRVYHTLDLDIANDELDEEENDAAEDDWLVKRAKKEGLVL